MLALTYNIRSAPTPSSALVGTAGAYLSSELSYDVLVLVLDRGRGRD